MKVKIQVISFIHSKNKKKLVQSLKKPVRKLFRKSVQFNNNLNHFLTSTLSGPVKISHRYVHPQDSGCHCMLVDYQWF